MRTIQTDLHNIQKGKQMSLGFSIRNISDERVYHNTAIMIYLKAVRDVFPTANVTIGNSLNQGYFSTIKDTGLTIGPEELHMIRDRMRAIIDSDPEITTEIWRAADAAEFFRDAGYKEKARLLALRDPDEETEIIHIDGYHNCMYSRALPSAGMVNLFELRTYRKGVLLRLPNALNPDTIPPYRDDDKLYDAYAESKRMRKFTHIDYLADINDIVHRGETAGVIQASEWLQSRQLEEYAVRIIEEGRKVVLIAGPSSSGKTTTAKRICRELERLSGSKPLYLGTDDYFVERKDNPIGPDGKPDFEGLGALDLKLFNSQMEALLSGEEVDLPEFDFVAGTKHFGKRITRMEPGQILVIEGIHSLNELLTQRIPRSDKFKIYISPLTLIGIDRHNRISTADARLLRRIVRDNQFRGYPADQTLEMWPKVRAGESANIFPYSSSADVVFNSSTLYETNMLRSFAEPLLLKIPEDSPQHKEAARILVFMKYFDRIEDTDPVPDNSILREFIGPRIRTEA